MKIFKYNYTVMFSDCDNAQIVFYPNFFQWFDRATQNMFIEVGLPWNEIWINYDIVGLPLVDASAKFNKPLRMEDEIVIESYVEEWGNKVWTIRHDVKMGDTVHVEGTEKRVWGKRDPDAPAGIRAEPVPDEVRALIGGE